MKTVLALLIILVTVSACNNSNNDKGKASDKDSLSAQSSAAMHNGDTIKYKDSVAYMIDNVRITTIPHKESVGEAIRVYSSTHTYVFDEADSYFYRLYAGCLVIDEGTGTKRTYKIVDMQSEKLIATFGYIAGLDSTSFSGTTMYCYISNIPTTELKRKNVPTCTDKGQYENEGVLLELIGFDMAAQAICYSGKFKCS